MDPTPTPAFDNESSQTTIQQMLSHKKFPHFVLYSLSCLFFGLMITALGPLLPYLAAHEGKDETEYSYLFTSRAFGFVVGAITVKIIQEKFTYHQFAAMGVCLMSVFAILFDRSQSQLFRGICVFFCYAGCAFQETSLNLSSLECFKGSNTVMWLQALHGFFGIGGLIGPFAVYLFELNSLTMVGIGSLLAIYFYFYLPTPEHGPHHHQQQSSNQQNRKLPNIGLYMISLGFFFTIGQQCSYGGWISSYAVLNNFSTKEHATLYSSIYWISITVFRFVFANIAGSSSHKIQALGLIGAVNSIVGYFIIFNINHQFGLYFMSIGYGLSNSSLYAFLLTVGQQFGYKIGIKQTTCFCVAGSIGEGFLTVGVGKMMGWASYNWLIYGMLLMNLSLALTARLTQQKLIWAQKRQGCDMGTQLLNKTVHQPQIEFH